METQGWIRVIAFSIALAACGSASAQSNNEWRWSITPYVWGSDIKTDVTFPSGEGIGGSVAFEDILDKLDMAAMLHAEGHRGNWGMFFDVTYTSMSDDTTIGPIPTTADLEFGLYEFAVVYTPGGATGPFSAFAGARIVDAALDMEFFAAGSHRCRASLSGQELHGFPARGSLPVFIQRSLGIERES